MRAVGTPADARENSWDDAVVLKGFTDSWCLYELAN